MKMKLLSSLLTTAMLIAASSPALPIEAEEGAEKNAILMAISQDAVFSIIQPATNASIRFVIEDTQPAYDETMNFAAPGSLYLHVSKEGVTFTSAPEDHPYLAATDISIYDSYISRGIQSADYLYRLELNDTATTCSGSSTAAEAAVASDWSYGSDSQLPVGGNNFLFILNCDRNNVTTLASAPKAPRNPPTLTSLVSSVFNAFKPRHGSTASLLNHSPLNYADAFTLKP